MAATFGQCCFKKGEGKMTYGTAGVFDVNCGDEPVDSKSGLLRYSGTIDGEFVLFEPVAKSSTVECRLRHSSVKPTGGLHTLTFTAEDNRHNKKTVTTTITY